MRRRWVDHLRKGWEGQNMLKLSLCGAGFVYLQCLATRAWPPPSAPSLFPHSRHAAGNFVTAARVPGKVFSCRLCLPWWFSPPRLLCGRDGRGNLALQHKEHWLHEKSSLSNWHCKRHKEATQDVYITQQQQRTLIGNTVLSLETFRKSCKGQICMIQTQCWGINILHYFSMCP